MDNNLKQLMQLLAFAVALKDGIVETLEDDKINFWDILNFKDLPKTIKPAFEGLGNPIERYKALSPADKATLHTEVYEDLGTILPAEMEALVAETLGAIHNLIEVSKKWAHIKSPATA